MQIKLLIFSSIICLNGLSQNPIPFMRVKKEINNMPKYTYVDSSNLNLLSKTEYNYAEPFDKRNGLAIVHLIKDRYSKNGIKESYYEAQLINKSFDIIFSITCEYSTDLDRILYKVKDSDGSLFYIFCELAHHEANNYIGDKYGLLGPNGKVITNAKYSSVSGFDEGIAIIKNFANEYGFIDTKGNETLTPSLPSEPSKFQNSRSIVKTELGWVYIDKFGKELGRTNDFNQTTSTYSDGVYKITDDEKYSIFKNNLGKTFLTLPYKTIGSFNKKEVICFVVFDMDRHGKVGVVNNKGNIILKPTYNLENYSVRYNYEEGKQYSYEFREGLAAVKTDYGWGFINTKGQLVIQDKYSDVSAFSEGFSVVKDLFGWSVINKKGEIVISYNQLKILNNSIYAGFINFENGFLTVILRGLGVYYVDKSGRELIQK